MNSIWGFLGKRNDCDKTEVIDRLGAYTDLVEREKKKEIVIKSILILEDMNDSLLVTYKPLKEEASKSGNIVLAVLTTAYARMALYKVIDEYSSHVIYFDTDSVFLHFPAGSKLTPPHTSTALGGLKDEILEEFGKDAAIADFVSLGPKSYSYR